MPASRTRSVTAVPQPAMDNATKATATADHTAARPGRAEYGQAGPGQVGKHDGLPAGA
jgi:hypothetical protein